MPISPPIRKRVRAVLQSCSALSNRTELLSLLSDARLAQWQGEIPLMDTVGATSDALIATLMGKWDSQRQNGLVLLLCMLGERDHNRQLGELAEEVRQELLQQQVGERQRELEELESHARQGWAKPDYVARRRAQLQSEMRDWEDEKGKPAPCEIAEQGQTAGTQKVAEEHYTDLEIHIFRSGDEGRYAVTAELDGEGKSSGVLQMGPGERQKLLEAPNPEAYGLALFDALFTGKVFAAYTTARERARAQTGGRLRLRLWIDDNAADLHALVWERLHDRHEDGAFCIATDANRPFSRYYGLQSPESAALAGKVRLLCILSNPQDLDEYNLAPLDDEIAKIQNILNQLARSGIEVVVMPGRTGLSPEQLRELNAAGCAVLDGPATLDHIYEQLLYAPGYDLVHYIGHGGFNDKHDQAVLFLEDEAGKVVRITDVELADKRLANLKHKPHLIFLAACKSAARSADNANPFVGLAPRLVRIGIPAVIAMQDTVGIEQAQKLTRNFYRLLMEDGVVDTALNQARGFLASGGWDVPVLFMRLREGRLIKRP